MHLAVERMHQKMDYNPDARAFKEEPIRPTKERMVSTHQHKSDRSREQEIRQGRDEGSADSVKTSLFSGGVTTNRKKGVAVTHAQRRKAGRIKSNQCPSFNSNVLSF